MKVKVLSVFEHFVSNLDGSINGLYKVSINENNTYTVFRNGNSWGILSHYLGEPVIKCVGFMRDDMIDVVEKAISDYLNGTRDDEDDYEFRRCIR